MFLLCPFIFTQVACRLLLTAEKVTQSSLPPVNEGNRETLENLKKKRGGKKTLSTGGWRFRKHQLSQEILVYILFVGEVLFFFFLLLLLFLLSVIKGGNLNCYYAIEFVRRLTVKCLPRLGSLRGVPR